jgi:hypothetical protein
MAQDQLRGAFLPTTDIFDRAAIDSLDVNSPEFKDFLVRLYQATNNIALSVNIRDAGYYDTQEFVNGQLFFPDKTLSSTSSTTPEFRQVFRTVVNFGALPNTATKSVAHGIDINTITDNNVYTFTRIYGCASDLTGYTYLPIPYASATAANIIELSVTSTNVVITTGTNRANYTVCYVILEYLKN